MVGEDNGYQKYLNYHTPCIRLWARVVDMLQDGSLAWKWSQTNVFLNKSGNAHVRGIWEDLENEVAIRMYINKKPPIDKYSVGGVHEVRHNPRIRELYVNCSRPDDRLQVQHLASTRGGRAVLANLESCHPQFKWSPMATNSSMWLYDHCKDDLKVCIESCKQHLVSLGVH